jgi:tetratricopeptide (TPR) repeat protein
MCYHRNLPGSFFKMPDLNASFWKSLLLTATCLALLSASPAVYSQEAFGDDATDPVRLFERGQSAHARGELERAIGFYEQALKVRPEFPEAEFQRGNALASLGRLPEAEAALRAAISYKKNWALPHTALGALLMRQSRDKEAEQFFQQALAIDGKESLALRLLSEIKLRAGDTKSALELAKRATAIPEAPAAAWVGLAIAEKANGDKVAAKTTLDRVLADEPQNLAALMERADLYTDEKNFELAITDLKAAAKLKPDDKAVLSRLAYALQQAGKTDEAAAAAKAAGLEVQQPTGNGASGVVGTPEEIEAANSSDSKNCSRRIRAAPCCSVVSALRIAPTIRLAHSTSTAALPKFNPTLPSTLSVMEQRWSRRVVSPTRHTFSNKSSRRLPKVMRRTRISRSRCTS